MLNNKIGSFKIIINNEIGTIGPVVRVFLHQRAGISVIHMIRS